MVSWPFAPVDLRGPYGHYTGAPGEMMNQTTMCYRHVGAGTWR
jgi:hypothetical protein